MKAEQQYKELNRLLNITQDLEDGGDPVASSDVRLELWKYACKLMDIYDFDCIEEVLTFKEEDYFADWIIITMVNLEDAFEQDRKYGNLLIEFCNDYLTRTNRRAPDMMFEAETTIGEMTFRLGGEMAADLLFDDLMQRFPRQSLGWTLWAELYGESNPAKAITILERALDIKQLDSRKHVLETLLDICGVEEEFGEIAEAVAEQLDDIYAAQVGGDGENGEHPEDCDCGDPHHHHEHHGHQHGPDCNHGPAEAAVTPGRNDPCPCGSGKKYKKCCGAAK